MCAEMECAYNEPEVWVTFSKNLLIVRGGCVYLWRGLGGTVSMAAIVVCTSCPTCQSRGVDCTCERLASADVAVVDCQATTALVNLLVVAELGSISPTAVCSFDSSLRLCFQLGRQSSRLPRR